MRPFVVPVAVLVCALAACMPKSQPDETDAVLSVIRANLSAMEREDIEGVMATLHPKMPDLADQQKESEKIFTAYDLKYELQELKVVSITPDEAKVSFVEKIHRINGPVRTPDGPPQLPDLLLVEGVHTLHKDGEKWKMYNTVNTHFTKLSPE